jgi:hypothetical protein
MKGLWLEKHANMIASLVLIVMHIGGSSRASARRAGLRGDGYFSGGTSEQPGDASGKPCRERGPGTQGHASSVSGTESPLRRLPEAARPNRCGS